MSLYKTIPNIWSTFKTNPDFWGCESELTVLVNMIKWEEGFMNKKIVMANQDFLSCILVFNMLNNDFFFII